MEQIGPYKLIRRIAQGGMGEVFLAHDPFCKREIALKRIRKEYSKNKTIYKRFVKEALIASQLTHPNIIPIYSLSTDEECAYYTMPYIHGKTLKQLLLEARDQNKNSNVSTRTETSVPYLVSIFATVCEAVAYAHSHRIIHRDLKPENILIGRHGEVIIFDWGVADKIENIVEEDPIVDLEELELTDLTSPGKVIGTLSFLAPERFESKLSNYLTDIYSLGVMLYIILTLRLPFKRKKLKEAKKNLRKEVFKNPIDVAPYRDIPKTLVAICKKCLQPDPRRRYQDMQELMKDLRDFTEGHAEWEQVDALEIEKESDWQFHENLLTSNHQAISLNQDALNWVALKISQKAYETNVQLKTTVQIQSHGEGLGLLINSPKADRRVHIIDGYHLWLSAHPDKPSLLFRNNVEVLRLPEAILKPMQSYEISLSKTQHRIECTLDGQLIFSYVSYLPLMDTHVGILHKDMLFKLSPLIVSTTSPSLIISCLEVPQSFFVQEMFDRALQEYRRIGKAFFGRHESREAFFRAGLTIIEQARRKKTKKDKLHFFDLALKEFENLRNTPGAPLEYLGKSLVYQEQKESEEELKCLELALRRYPNHPLLYLIYDHIIYRLYQSSHENRLDTHKFIFLALRYNAYAKHKQMIDPLILNLTDRRHMLFFLEECSREDLKSHYLQMIIQLAFLLGRKNTYEEILDSYTLDAHFIRNILVLSWLMNQSSLVDHSLNLLPEKDQHLFKHLKAPISMESFEFLFQDRGDAYSLPEENIALLLIDQSLCLKKFDLIEDVFKKFSQAQAFNYKKQDFAYYEILIYLLNHKPQIAAQKLKEHHALFADKPHRQLFLQGALYASVDKTKEAKKIFNKELETSLPDVDMLASLYLSGQLDYEKWSKDAFPFEKKQLFKQLFFYYTLAKDTQKASSFYQQWKNIIL